MCVIKSVDHFDENSLGIIVIVRAVGSRSAGGAIAPPIFLDMKKKVVFSTPNISRLKK